MTTAPNKRTIKAWRSPQGQEIATGHRATRCTSRELGHAFLA